MSVQVLLRSLFLNYLSASPDCYLCPAAFDPPKYDRKTSPSQDSFALPFPTTVGPALRPSPERSQGKCDSEIPARRKMKAGINLKLPNGRKYFRNCSGISCESRRPRQATGGDLPKFHSHSLSKKTLQNSVPASTASPRLARALARSRAEATLKQRCDI